MQKSSANIASFIIFKLKEHNNKKILICDALKISSEKFLYGVQQRYSQLVSNNGRPGDRIFVTTGRGIQYWIDIVAVWCLGGIIIPFDKNMSSEHKSCIYNKASPRFVLSNTILCEDWDVINIGLPENGLDDNLVELELASYETAAILFTSGSTGEPKGVILSHELLLFNIVEVSKRIKLRPTDRLFVSTDFHFTSAICHFLASMYTGATFACTEKKLLHNDLANAIHENNATCFGGSPVQVRWLVECANANPFNLRWVMSSGDHLTEVVIKEFKKNLPDTDLFVVYGLTEVGGRLCILMPNELEQKKGSVGKPLDGIIVKVLNDNGRVCHPGEPGEIFVGKPYVFSGYFNETKNNEGANGFYTGDIGHYDSDGYIFLHGRKDLVFKCAGKKISSISIQEQLEKLHVFADVVVIPIEHDILGHVPCAVFTKKDDTAFKKGEVLSALSGALPRNHLPRVFFEIETMPRTGSGKPIYKKIRQLAKVLSKTDKVNYNDPR